MLKAVIFDMDGVIIDSEPMHARAAVLALKEYNVDVTLEYLISFIGTTTYKMCQRMIEDFEINNVSVEDLVEANNRMKKKLLAEEGYTEVPYVTDLIQNLNSNHLKLAIASSSSEEAIERVMDSFHIRSCFQGYVSGNQVQNPKPSPDIFQEAAKMLGVSPNECIVIEDSSHGVSAAKAAGMVCIGYFNPNSGQQDLRKADIIVEGFDEIDSTFVHQIYQQCLGSGTELSTPRTVIRELTTEDIPSLYQLYCQNGIREYMDNVSDTLEIEIEKHKAYIQNVYRYYGYGLWGVFDKNTDTLIGRCGIELKTIDGEAVYELGYLLDKEYQGNGYANEFVSEVIRHSFQNLNVPRILALIDKKNTPSIKLVTRIGFKLIGTCQINHRACNKYELINQKS